jgi:thiol-disulfide isomerase/thioredoxin
MSLINFYGTECPHCERMIPIMDKLEKETGVTIERLEVWHSEANRAKYETYDRDDACGGVPFFVNTTTSKTICGEATYEELLEWAK